MHGRSVWQGCMVAWQGCIMVGCMAGVRGGVYGARQPALKGRARRGPVHSAGLQPRPVDNLKMGAQEQHQGGSVPPAPRSTEWVLYPQLQGVLYPQLQGGGGRADEHAGDRSAYFKGRHPERTALTWRSTIWLMRSHSKHFLDTLPLTPVHSLMTDITYGTYCGLPKCLPRRAVKFDIKD